MKQRGLLNCCKTYCKREKENIQTKLSKTERERERGRERERDIYGIIWKETFILLS